MKKNSNPKDTPNSLKTTQIEPQTQNSTEATPEAVSAPISPNYDYLDQSPEELDRQRALLALAQGQTATYIKDKVYANRKLWWENWEAMMSSGNDSDRKIALVEYNKLQLRILPTQLEGPNGQSVVVNVIGMGVEQPPEDTKDYIDGEVTSVNAN